MQPTAVRIISLIQPWSMVTDPEGVTLRGETQSSPQLLWYGTASVHAMVTPSLTTQVWAVY